MTGPWLNPWVVVAAAIFGTLLVLAGHTMLPRYDWRPVGDGHAIVVYDRWSGRLQRAEWDADGKLRLSDVYTAP
jgi:hypothetical protein